MSERSLRRAQQRRTSADARREAVRRRRLGLVAGAAVGAAALLAPSAHAATFQVTSNADDGIGSLRDAVSQADAAGGADDITFASTVTGTIRLTSGQITVYNEDDLTIVGPGASVLTVSGDADSSGTPTAGDSRILETNSYDSTLSISGLTLSGGFAENGSGGAVRASGRLTLVDMVVSGNTAYRSGGGLSSGEDLTVTTSSVTGNTAGNNGGGVYADDDATLTSSTVSGNTASGPGGGVFVYYYSTLTTRGTTISDNTAGDDGGGAYAGLLDVRDSTVSGNRSTGDHGGGLYTEYGGSITGSVVSGNAAGEDGGGVYADGPLTVGRTVVRDNTADGFGGGIGLDDDDLTLDRSLVAGNTATRDGGGIGFDEHDGSSIRLTQSTVSGNTAGADAAGGGLAVPRLRGTVALTGSTISGNRAGTGAGIALGTPNEPAYSGNPEVLDLATATIVGNVASVDGGGIALFPADEAQTAANQESVALDSTIVAGNTAAGAAQDLFRGPAVAEAGGIFRPAFSLVQTPGSAPVDPARASTNLFGVDPALGALADNGGATPTHLPAAASPVLDRGDSLGRQTVDQRDLPRVVDNGNPRPVGGNGADIGSVERPLDPRQAPPGPAPAPGPADAPPAVAFTAPAPGKLLPKATATTLRVTATDDKGVVRVRFLDRGRVLCDDTTAPYTCDVRPTGADVGRKDFEAVAVDTVGQTTSASLAARVSRFSVRSVSLTVAPKRDARLPFTFVSTGRIVLPARVARAQGCDGRVAIQIKAGGSTVSNRRVKLSPTCTFRSPITFRVPKRLRGELTVRAVYLGSAVLNPRRSPSATIDVG